MLTREVSNGEEGSIVEKKERMVPEDGTQEYRHKDKKRSA